MRHKVAKSKRLKRTRERWRAFRLEPLEDRLLLSTVSWVGGSGSWNTAGNWSTDTIPQAGDTVIISKTGSIQVTLTGSASVSSISVTGDTLDLSGGTLTLAASSSINAGGSLVLSSASLVMSSGTTFTNSGSITVNPLSQMSVGTYSQTSGGSLTLPSGTLLNTVANNLLSNAGFESPTAGNSTTDPSNWGDWGTSYLSTQYAHLGAQSVVESGSNSGVNQSFSATPGVSYIATVYAMTPSTAKLTGPEVGLLNLLFYNSSGTQVGSDGITVLNANSAAGGPNSGSVGNQGWNFYSTTGVAPVGTTTVTIALQVGPYSGISGTAGGSVFFDDAQLGITAVASAAVSATSVSNSGTISIGDADEINDSGAFTQTSTGTLTILLGGPSAGGLYGSLDATGAASLGGTLKANLTNSYSPTVGDSFTLLDYSSLSGAFSSVTLPSGSSYVFQSGINPTYLGISALPTAPATSVNIGTVLDSASPNLVGINLAYWDDQLNTSETQSMVEAAGLDIFRFPGGSASDDFHFNVANNYGDPSANTIPQFAEFVDNAGGQGMVTIDYGSGSPQEAEAEAAYLIGSPSDTTVIGNGQEWNDSTKSWQTVNWQTVGYWAGLRAASPLQTNDGLNFLRIDRAVPFTGINYWEVGNEEYGNWEVDHYAPSGVGGNSTSPYNYPAAYAQFAASFSAFVTADKMLPSILIGIDSGDPSGKSDNNWTANVLADGFADGFVPGFISDHNYMQAPGSESDSFLLNDTVSDLASILDWSTRAADYHTLLVNALGSSKAAGVQLMATEFNSVYADPGKQSTSLVNGLFVADSIGSLLNSGYTGGLVWDLRNGWDTGENNSSTLYGWREGGDYGILGDPNDSDPPSTGPYVPYPTYFSEQLASKIVRAGGEAVSASSSYSGFDVYAVLEANGHLDLMVINKNPDAAVTEQFNLTGFTANGQAEFWQYGEAQDYAQSQSSNGASSLANFAASLTFSGNSFSYAFPAYSMTVIDLTPLLTVATAAAANPNPSVGTFATALSALGSENGSGSNLTYTWSATGPAPVTYTGAANDSSAAKNITADFTQIGIYNFLVTITDAGGQTVTSPVQVTILPTFAGETGSIVMISLNNVDPITVATSGSNTTVTEAGYQYSFSGVTGITVDGATSTAVLNFDGPLAVPFTFAADGNTVLNVVSGTLTFAADIGGTISLGTLSVSSGAEVIITPTTSNTPSTLSVNSLSIGSTARLDVTNNEVLVNYVAGNDPISTIAGWIASGYANAAWNGAGIISSPAGTNSSYGLGYSDAADAGNPVGLPTGEIEILYTLLGGANLDGKVNGSDFTLMSAHFNQSGCSWDEGDFNYDGDVNGSDFVLQSENLNQFANLSAATAAASTTATVASTAAAPAITTVSGSDSNDVVGTVLGKHAAKKKSRHG